MAPSSTKPITVLNGVTANATSAAVSPEATSVELLVGFSDGSTSCSVTLLVDDGAGNFSAVGTRNGVNALKGDLYFGSFDDNTSLQGRAVKVQITNYTGSGSITVRLNRTA